MVGDLQVINEVANISKYVIHHNDKVHHPWRLVERLSFLCRVLMGVLVLTKQAWISSSRSQEKMSVLRFFSTKM